MHFTYFLVGFLVFITQRSSASYPQEDSNGIFYVVYVPTDIATALTGGSQMENQGAPTFMHMHTPMMYSAPLVGKTQVIPLGPDDINSLRSRVRSLVGSYGEEQGHHTDIIFGLPFRKARARKLAARRAARMRKNLRRHRKVNKH
ncbi:hypothetical protein Y032_0008g80 [Ancylostoma ceylanicum]|uniref:Uncharacterized protein n=1 Tax=Ancylostoma ceylanicum TaxID=53326 RepID=A0A016VNE6_9BILA|nr:hypothetical protein Y032_0008g80 [Ancylostoma ceylanicum]